MSNSIPTSPDPPSQEPREYLVCGWGTIRDFINTCPRAQTLLAWSVDYRRWLMLPLACGTWTCRWCARKKVRVLAARVMKANPNRFLTLTVDPKLHDNPRAAYDSTRRKIATFFRDIRLQYGPVEYFRVTEITKAGWPHYHFLLRSRYIPHKAAKNSWARLTGATIVDIRQVKKLFHAAHYITKYLSKLHEIPWTDRHISNSKNFFPPEEPREHMHLTLTKREIVNQHPVNFLINRNFKLPVENLLGNFWAMAGQNYPQRSNQWFDSNPVFYYEEADSDFAERIFSSETETDQPEI